MKVLIVCPHNSNKGGLVKVAERQYKIFNENALACDYFFTSTRSNSIVGQIIKMLYFPFFLLFGRYDVVHIHVASRKSYYRKFLYFLFSSIFGKLFVVHIHGGAFKKFINSSRFSGETLRYILKRKKCQVVCLTNDLSTFLSSNYIISNEPFVLKNPGRVENFSKEALTTENRENNRLIFVGRLCEAKGIKNLVIAIHSLKELGHTYYLDIYGDGALKEEITELIYNLKLCKYITLKGWVDDSTIQYFEYTFNVLPSKIEAMPLSVIEAMQQGVPSIVTNVGAIGEMLDDGEDSVFLKDNSPDEIMSGILRGSNIISPQLVDSTLKNFNDNYSSSAFMSSCLYIYSIEG